VIKLIDVLKLDPFLSTSVDGQYTFTVSPTGSIHASPNGEVVGVKILDLGSATVATAYVKVSDSVITGATGTFFDRQGSGTVSGATPAFYPVRVYSVDPAGCAFGSPNSAGCPYPTYGDLLITCGSLGSPVTFSGVEVYIKR
jgi:hypothetical protein